MSEPGAFVVEADVALDKAADPAAVGAAVTVELCGSWDHEGPCRFPHNNEIDAAADPARLRTVFVADAGEADAIAARIEASLRGGGPWHVVEIRRRAPARDELSLAKRLAAGPRAAG